MKKLTYLLIILFAFGTWSCVDDFEKINSDPHAFEVDPGSLFSTTIMCISSDKQQIWAIDLGMCSSVVQHLAGAWDSSTGGQYNPVSVDVFNSLWDNYYVTGINNINDVVKRTKGDEKNYNLHWAARIWRVYMFSRLTDMYGDIPYFDASKGFSDKNYSPKYDLQSDIYADFFVELDSAVNMMDAEKYKVTGDLLYDGDVDSWIKFGNSLRLRLGLRLWERDATEAEVQVRAAIEGGVFESNSDNCLIPYGQYTGNDGEFRGNGTGQLFAENDRDQGMTGFRLTNTLVDYMKNSNDPRLLSYGRMYDYANSDYIDITHWFDDEPDFLQGIPHGNYWWDDAEYAPGDYADWEHYYEWGDGLNGRPDEYMHAFDSRYLMPSEFMAHSENPFYVITYGEVELLLAEAAVHGWGASDPETHFANAIQAYCDLIPEALAGAPVISSAEVTSFMNTIANPFPASTDDQLELINTQLWVALYLDPLEAYSNWRRSGYPDLQPYQGSQDGYSTPGSSTIPLKLKYPNYEEFYNPVNYQEAIGRLSSGENSWNDRVWWDVN